MVGEEDDAFEAYFAMPNPPGYPFFDEDGDGDIDPEFLEGPKVRANGILIAPNIVLTQGGHYGNGRRTAVSFREQVGDIDPDDDTEFDAGAGLVRCRASRGSGCHVVSGARVSRGLGWLQRAILTTLEEARPARGRRRRLRFVCRPVVQQ